MPTEPTEQRGDDVRPIAYQAQPHLMPPETWTLTLNRYQRDNLLQLVQRLMEGDETPLTCFNTGDWVGEVRWMLGKRNSSGVGPGVPSIQSIDADDSPMPPRPASVVFGRHIAGGES